jgi:hypothetical protein
LRRFPQTPLTPVWTAFLPLAHTDVAVSHQTALWLLRLRRDAPSVIDLTLPRSERWRRAHPGTRLHFASLPTARPPISLAGLPVVHPSTAILSMVAAEGASRSVQATSYVALRRGLVTQAELAAGWPRSEMKTLRRLAQ